MRILIFREAAKAIQHTLFGAPAPAGPPKRRNARVQNKRAKPAPPAAQAGLPLGQPSKRPGPPVSAPSPQPSLPLGGGTDPSHGGKLHLERKTDSAGRTQGRWVASPEPSPAPARAAEAESPPSDSSDARWHLGTPSPFDRPASRAWLDTAPQGATLQVRTGGKPGYAMHTFRRDEAGWRRHNGEEWAEADGDAMLDAMAEPGAELLAGHGNASASRLVPKGQETGIRYERAGREFQVPASSREEFLEKIGKLSKKAEKMGLGAIEVHDLGTDLVRVTHTRGHTFEVEAHRFWVASPAIRAPGGWEFIGHIHHHPAGNLLSVFKEPDGVDMRHYRSVGNTCDHCRTTRDRKDTYLLQSADGAVRRVGRSCLKDFLGHQVPLTGWQRLVRDLDDLEGGRFNDLRHASFPARQFLAAVAAMIRRDGFAPSAHGPGATKHQVTEYLLGRGSMVDPLEVTEADEAVAMAALDWARALDAGDNDYLHNVKTVLQWPRITPKARGLAAAAVSTYLRERAKEERAKAEREAAKNAPPPLGKPNDVIGRRLTAKDKRAGREAHPPVEVKVLHTYETEYHTGYGPPRVTPNVVAIDADGRQYVFPIQFGGLTNHASIEAVEQAGGFPSGGRESAHWHPAPGDELTIHKATIKAHDEYRGQPQTRLQRVKVSRSGIPDLAFVKAEDHSYPSFIRELAVHRAHRAGLEFGQPGFNEALEAEARQAMAEFPPDATSHKPLLGALRAAETLGTLEGGSPHLADFAKLDPENYPAAARAARDLKEGRLPIPASPHERAALRAEFSALADHALAVSRAAHMKGDRWAKEREQLAATSKAAKRLAKAIAAWGAPAEAAKSLPVHLRWC